MCAVSAVGDVWMQRFPDPFSFPQFSYPAYLEALEKARKYDELMKQKDCVHPEKAAWHNDLERIMKEKYGLEPK